MRYLPEPAHHHGTGGRSAILLVNLGTPEAPSPGAVRRYLREFLWDPRVVEIPRPVWWLILNGIVLTVRPAATARKYARVWLPDGSPLKVHTEAMAARLAERLAEPGEAPMVPTVSYAMRYGKPSIAATLSALKAAGAQRILVLPLYPQYAASTTGAVMDALAAWTTRTRNLPELRLVRSFHDHPAYIGALAAGIRGHWQAHGRPNRLLMSFHGLPRYTLDRGDPYHCECHKTARLLAEALEISATEWQLAFQSRFGRAQWLQPYTGDVLRKLGREGLGRVDVVCPGFPADCLETLEELGIEGREIFIGAGGRDYRLIPCLNASDAWIDGLSAIARDHLGGWRSPSAEESAASARRARELGATE